MSDLRERKLIDETVERCVTIVCVAFTNNWVMDDCIQAMRDIISPAAAPAGTQPPTDALGLARDAMGQIWAKEVGPPPADKIEEADFERYVNIIAAALSAAQDRVRLECENVEWDEPTGVTTSERIGHSAAAKKAIRSTAPTSVQPQEPVETAWLVEKFVDGQGPHWIGVLDGLLAWTPDPLKVLRLSRKEDADKLCEIVDDAEKVTEHMWCAPTSAGTPSKRDEWTPFRQVVWFQADGCWMAKQSIAVVGKIWPADDKSKGAFFWRAQAWATKDANGKTGNGYSSTLEQAKKEVETICAGTPTTETK